MIVNNKKTILPIHSVKYLFYGVIVISIILFVLEFYLIKDGEKHKWDQENELISKENYKRIKNSIDSPLWQISSISAPINKKNKKRILVVGDSYVWGDGLLNLNHTWWRQLAIRLRNAGYENVEVFALGVNGASTSDQFYWLSQLELLNKLEPDLLIFGYVTNDPQMKNSQGQDIVQQTKPFVYDASLVGNILPKIDYKIQKKIHTKKMSKSKDSYTYSLWEEKILQGDNFEQYKDMLYKFANFLKKEKVPYFFVTTPVTLNPYKYRNTYNQQIEIYNSKYKKVSEAFDRYKMPFINLLQNYQERFENNKIDSMFPISPANGHPSVILTSFYADQVMQILENNYSFLLNKKTRGGSEYPQYVIDNWFPTDVSVEQISNKVYEFNYPVNKTKLPHMSLGVPHVILNFSYPMEVKKIRILHKTNANVKLWVTVINSLEERSDINVVGVREKNGVIFNFGDLFKGKKIESLKVSLDNIESENKVKVVRKIKTEDIISTNNNSYFINFPEYEKLADSSDNSHTSPFLLMEDATLLHKQHELHENIANKGGGRYSHWNDVFIFSSTDNTNPITNGRQYKIVLPPDPIKLILKIDGEQK